MQDRRERQIIGEGGVLSPQNGRGDGGCDLLMLPVRTVHQRLSGGSVHGHQAAPGHPLCPVGSARNLAFAEKMGMDIVAPCANCFNRLRYSQQMVKKKIVDIPWELTGDIRIHDITRFLAGSAHSPRFLSESITMAKSAGQQAVQILCRETMQTLAAVAEVDPDQCVACLACVRECPFQVPVINEEGVSEISPTGCRGCGVCTAVCPRRAITLKHSTDDQLNAKIDALLEVHDLAA